MKGSRQRNQQETEDRLTVYIAPGTAFADELFSAFREHYPGIDTSYVHEPAVTFFERVLSELARGTCRADVMLLNSQQMEVLKTGGFLEPYESPESASYPERAKDADGYGTQILLKPFSIAYNTNLVHRGELPGTYEDLLAPKWAGRLLYQDPRKSGCGVGWYAVMKDHLGAAFFERLAGQRPFCQHNPETLLAEGRYPILIAAMVDRIEKMKAAGKPVEWIAMPVMWFAGPFAVLFRTAPHPNLARRFLDFLLSSEGQHIISGYGIPNRPGVPVKEEAFRSVRDKIKDVQLVSFTDGHGREYFKNQSDVLTLFPL